MPRLNSAPFFSSGESLTQDHTATGRSLFFLKFIGADSEMRSRLQRFHVLRSLSLSMRGSSHLWLCVGAPWPGQQMLCPWACEVFRSVRLRAGYGKSPTISMKGHVHPQSTGAVSHLVPPCAGTEGPFLSRLLYDYREGDKLGRGITQSFHTCL